jgi:hypothetical protein
MVYDDAADARTTAECWIQFLGEANNFGLDNPADMRSLALVAASRYIDDDNSEPTDRWEEMRTRGFERDMIKATHEVLGWAPDLFRALDDLRRASGLSV